MTVTSRLLAALLLAAATTPSHADEGMWMLHQVGELDQVKLRTMGLQLSPKDIWDPAKGSGLASAIVSLGGCSASFVSPEGLVATNHHCAFRAIQSNSSPEHDYITDGFLAADRPAELQARGSRVFVFLGYDDVTARMKAALTPAMSGEQRARAIETREKELTAECEKAGVRCRVATMFGGGAYYMFRQLELRDVRLVYAPPRAIGEYGGETDNWEWPRHTGDFSFLRAYVGPDGKPADYSPANLPYRPARWLKLASEPLRDGDFTMIMGYPGRTFRYRIAAAVAEDTEHTYPERIALYKAWIDVLEKRSATSKEVEIKVASTLKGLFNTLKKSEGMLEGLSKADLAGHQRATETQLNVWIDADGRRKARYGDVLPALERLQRERAATRERDALLASLPRASSLLNAAITIERWSDEKAKPELEREDGYQQRDERQLRLRLVTMQHDLDLDTERATLSFFLARAAALPVTQRIPAIDAALHATGAAGEAAVTALVDTLVGGTALAEQKTRLAWFDGDHAAVVSKNDPMIGLAGALHADEKARESEQKRREGERATLEPSLFDALRAWRATPLYPDANGTLRFTYATVKGYAPRDGVVNLPFTTLAGVVAKNTGNAPFACPQRLLHAAAGGPFPRYADTRVGDVPACFLSTNDITGGNSGSPIMNGKGELVGLAFDGDYESMTSDYLFDNALSRTINVDARYMLWVMDYVDRAHGLLREMGVEPRAR